MKGQSTCSRCCFRIEPGTAALVIGYGANGRIHKHCVRPGEEVRLANGNVYRRSSCLNSDAAMGTLRTDSPVQLGDSR